MSEGMEISLLYMAGIAIAIKLGPWPQILWIVGLLAAQWVVAFWVVSSGP